MEPLPHGADQSPQPNPDAVEEDGTTPGMPREEEPRPKTMWHPLFRTLLELNRPSSTWEILEEFPLSLLPPRVDLIVIRRDETPFEIEGLSALFNRFLHPGRRRAILEFKSPEDRLEAQDLHTILGYLNFYNRHQKILEPDETFLVTLSDGISQPFVEQLRERYRCRWAEVEPGVWEVSGLPWALYCIDLTVASRCPGNHLLGAFTRGFLQAPAEMLTLLNTRESSIMILLMQRIEQLRATFRLPYLKGMSMVDLDLVHVIRDAILQLAPERAMRLMSALPPEQRLAGLPPEQRLAGLSEAERQELFMLLSRSAKPATTGGVVAP